MNAPKANTAHKARMVTVKEAMEYGGFRRTRFYQLVAAGRIEAIKDGRRTMVDLSSIDSYLDSLPRVAGAPLAPDK